MVMRSKKVRKYEVIWFFMSRADDLRAMTTGIMRKNT
jgi:hypothetical protein